MVSDVVRRIELHGHRGARGLVAENTITSFRAALELGVDGLELDVGMSRDGHLVVHHDTALNADIARIDGAWIAAPRLLKDLSLEELRAFDVAQIRPGTRYGATYSRQRAIERAAIPSFDELLAMPELAARPEVRLLIEIKTSPEAVAETHAPEAISAALVEVLDRAGFRKRARIQSFDWRNLTYLARHAPDISRGFLTVEQGWLDTVKRDAAAPSPWLAGGDLRATGGSLPEMIRQLGGSYWAPHHLDIEAEAVRCAHDAGLKVIVWTVNGRDDMRRVIDMGVDGIITDYPDVGAEVIEATTHRG